MEQQLEVQGFDFSVVPVDKRKRARELDAQCDDAIQKLSFAVDEIGEILTEMKDILPHGSFRSWGHSKGLTDRQITYAMDRVNPRKQPALDMIEENVQFVHFDAPAIPERAKSTEEKDHKLAELEEKLRTANERLFSVEGQVAHYKEQLVIAQAQASQPPKTIERRVEVVPQHVLDRQKELETRLRTLQVEKTQLQTQAAQVKKERDLYKRDLDNERKADNDLFLKNLEPEGTSRLRANFAEVMHEIVAWCRTSGMKLPSVVDTQVFEAEDWHRLEEAIQANALLGRELRKIKDMVSSPQVHQPFIIDTTVEEWVS